METRAYPPGLQDVLAFPLVEALYGRRARRFSLGTSIPDGPLAFTSQHDPLPLSELEQMLVLTAAAGNTGWHYMITRHARYAPHLSNYSAAAGGRTFPSAAGFHTSEVFFTDDEGVYLFETRDAPKLVEQTTDGPPDLDAVLEAHRTRIRKLSEGRLYIPAEEPYMEGHNTRMIAVGEKTGDIDGMLTKIAEFYESEVDATVKALTSIIEPLMIVVVGGIIIAMYLPMFRIFELIE